MIIVNFNCVSFSYKLDLPSSELNSLQIFEVLVWSQYYTIYTLYSPVIWQLILAYSNLFLLQKIRVCLFFLHCIHFKACLTCMKRKLFLHFPISLQGCAKLVSFHLGEVCEVWIFHKLSCEQRTSSLPHSSFYFFLFYFFSLGHSRGHQVVPLPYCGRMGKWKASSSCGAG